MTPRQLSEELREGQSPDLTRRRWLLGLSLVGAAAGGIVGMYQMGIFRRLPDLPLPIFNATKVDKAPYAYKRMQTPDGTLMLLSYATTAILAAAGGKDRARTHPVIPIALAAKVVADTAVALKLAKEEWDDTKAFCGYCQSATVASAVSVALAMPETIKAVQNLLSGGTSRAMRHRYEHPQVRGTASRAWEMAAAR